MIIKRTRKVLENDQQESQIDSKSENSAARQSDKKKTKTNISTFSYQQSLKKE